jgi:hypothetical protein
MVISEFAAAAIRKHRLRGLNDTAEISEIGDTKQGELAPASFMSRDRSFHRGAAFQIA